MKRSKVIIVVFSILSSFVSVKKLEAEANVDINQYGCSCYIVLLLKSNETI